MIIGAGELQWPENAVEQLFTPADISCRLAALAHAVSLTTIGIIRVQALLDGTSSEAENLPSHGRFQSLQIQFLCGLATEQRLDVPQDFSRQEVVESGFF
jgi:hypothetical protein